jgi:ATP-dependent DNA helicase RecQ
LRATILRYFGDPAAHEPCDACSNCRRRSRLDDSALLTVRKILSGIARGGERYGRRRIAAMLVGRTEELPEALAALSTTGLLASEPPSAVERWIDSAIGGGLIKVSSDTYRTLGLTPLGRDVMAGRVAEVEMSVPIIRTSGSKRRRSKNRGNGSVSAHDAGGGPEFDRVVEALRAWRRDQASERGIPAFVVLHDRTLEAIASRLPRTLGDLANVSGIGPAKLSTFGEAIVSVIAANTTPAETR